MKRIFAVMMAVLCLTVCMCMPALAATNVNIENGVSFSASHWTDDNGGTLNYLTVEHGVTYTITTDPSITKLDLWVYKTSSRANSSLTFVDGVCEYVCTDEAVKGIVILCGDAESRPTVTVSWPRPPEPGLLDFLSLVGGAIWTQITIVSSVISENALLFLTVGFLFVGGCIAIFGRLLRKS